MSKFVIECPKCGRFAEAKTGFFSRKKIDCACGYVIDVRTDKLASRVCPHCGNNVVFDQSKGADAKCPVCGESINTRAEQDKMIEFSCRQCGVRLRAAKGASTFVCPVCDCENDLSERIQAEKIRKDGLASIIKYEGAEDAIVWKHPIEDFNFGSQLIVHESQEAIFFRDGQALDAFGAGRYTLETQQLPMLEKLYKLPTDTEGTFHSEVYFVNLAVQMAVKWGTDSKVRLFDPASGLHVELGASGEFTMRVINGRKFLLKVVGTGKTFTQEQLMGGNGKGYFRAMVMAQVKSYLASAIRENGISVLEIDERLMELGDALREKINPRLAEYGLEMPEFYVSRVVTPDDDPNFRRMKEQYAEQYLLVRDEQIKKREAEAAAQRKAVEAQTAAQMKVIGAQGEADALRIRKQAEADAYRMQASAEAEEMRMKGYTYQQETARQVGMQAMQNGLTGSAAGGLGDIVGLGVGLGTMSGVIGMTKEAMSPAMSAMKDGWSCDCGQTGITGNFCPNCGKKKPETGWSCDCGQTGITGNFCPNCGKKKPEAGWSCDCGQTGITGNFCPNCGKKKPEAGWNCDCGQTGITGNFCPNCGKKRPDPAWNCPECGQTGIKTKFCPNCGHKKEEN